MLREKDQVWKKSIRTLKYLDITWKTGANMLEGGKEGRERGKQLFKTNFKKKLKIWNEI